MSKMSYLKVVSGNNDGMTIALKNHAGDTTETFFLSNKAALELVGEINNQLNRNK